MTLKEFINKWGGKKCDFDGYYGGQCMDLMHQYILEIYGLPGSVLQAPTAYKAFVNGDPHFERISISSGLTPQSGDIIFWNDQYIKGTGHVAIFVGGDSKVFSSFDQNWPEGSASHLQHHNYEGVAGWLRYKQSKQDNDIRMIKFVENKRVVWVKTGDIGDIVDDYWLIIDEKKRRRIKKEDYELMVPLFGQYAKMGRVDWGQIANMEEGEVFDYYNTLTTHPELFESLN